MQPNNPFTQYVLRGIKRSPAHSPRLPRMPITPAILRTLKATAATRDRDFVMLWGACCMGFFGFMRAGEFTVTHVSEFDPAASLCLGDIAVDRHQDPSVVQVRLKQSKTAEGSQLIWAERRQSCAQWLPFWHISQCAPRSAAPCLCSRMVPSSPETGWSLPFEGR